MVFRCTVYIRVFSELDPEADTEKKGLVRTKVIH